MRRAVLLLSSALLTACAPSGDAPERAEQPYPIPTPDVGKADFSSGVADHGALPVGGERIGALTLEFEFHGYSFSLEEAAKVELSAEGGGFEPALFLFGPWQEGEGWKLSARGARVEASLEPGRYTVVLGSADGISKGEYTLTSRCLDCAAPPVEPPEVEPPSAPEGACADVELGNSLGEAVATGTTAGGQDRVHSECAGGDAPEALLSWQAPEDGWYRFSTHGSSFGTVLYLLDACDGVELSCNNNAAPGTWQSLLDYELSAGDQVIIGVDGYSGHQGDYALNILRLDAAEGNLHGERLRERLLEEVRGPHRSVGYDRARAIIFGQLHNKDGVVECVYTGARISTRGIPANEVMNVEHTWPKSRGAADAPAVSDLHHLFPSDSETNSRRASYRFGEVESVWWSSDDHGDEEAVSSLGADAQGRSVFQPRAEHRGDVARALFYFSVRYEHRIGHGEEEILRRWHATDPPDAVERRRNARVEGIQGNRNPFIDRPALVDRIYDF